MRWHTSFSRDVTFPSSFCVSWPILCFSWVLSLEEIVNFRVFYEQECTELRWHSVWRFEDAFYHKMYICWLQNNNIVMQKFHFSGWTWNSSCYIIKLYYHRQHQKKIRRLPVQITSGSPLYNQYLCLFDMGSPDSKKIEFDRDIGKQGTCSQT